MRICIYFLCALLTSQYPSFAREDGLDSLKNLLNQNEKNTTQKAEINTSIAHIYDKDEKFNDAIIYYSNALEYYRELQDLDNIANTLIVLGKNHSFSGDDVKSLACFQEVLTFRDKLSDQSAIGDAMHNTGIIHQYDSKHDSAFYYYKNALEKREKLGDSSKIAGSLRAMGEILRIMDRRDEALKYCLKALSYKDHINKKTLANIYNETGYIYELNGILDTALAYYQNVVDLGREVGIKRVESIGLANSAVIYERLGQYDKTLEYHFKALKIDQEINYGYGIMKDYYLIAITYKLLKKYDIALDYLVKSDSLCNARWSMDNQENQELYYQIYKESGNFHLALQHHEKFAQIKDSISGKEVQSKIAQLNTEYETEKKEQEIKYLNAENDLKDQKLKLGTILILSLILLGVLSIFVFLLLFRQKELRIKNMHTELRNFLLEVEELKLAVSDRQEWEHNKINDLLKKYEITDREADVLHMISHGHNNSEIADKLFISINTVKYHVKNLYLKLDAKNRVEIINRFSPDRMAVST